mgnify:CR=1 FL=1
MVHCRTGSLETERVGMFLFPTVPVAASGGKVLEFGKESFLLYNTARAQGGATKRIKFGHLGKPYSLVNHDLDAVVPREQLRDASVVPGIDLASRAINGLMHSETLVLENEQATLARDLNNYPATHKVTLSGTGQWGNAASDPIGDIDTAKEAIRSATGMYPNVIEISALAFKVLKRHANIIELIKYSQRGVVTAELLAQIFDVDRVVIGKAIGFDDAGASIDIWGKDVILAYVPTVAVGQEQPSYAYTYTMVGNPAVEVPWYDKGSKSWIYGTSYERAAVLSGISSGYIIKNAVA